MTSSMGPRGANGLAFLLSLLTLALAVWMFRTAVVEGLAGGFTLMGAAAENSARRIEALKNSRIRFGEISIQYSSRLGEIKLNPWRDGFYNLFFLVKKRFSRKRVK